MTSPCVVSGCPNIAVKNGRCQQCQPSAVYNTVLHKRWAAAVKARDPYCVDPYDRHPNERRRTEIADHIKPVRDGGWYSMTNGRGVCWSCHEYGKARS